jgi:integrase
MSTLYKRKNSPYFWYSTGVYGRRIRLSTGTRSRRTAEKIQNTWDYRLAQGDTSFFEETGDPMDVQGYIKHHLSFLSDRKTDNTVLIAKGVLTKFGEYLELQGINTLASVQLKDIDGYLDSMQRTSKTKKNHLGVVSRMFNQAVKEEILERNPCEFATPPRVVHEVKHRPLEPKDLKTIFADPTWKLYYSFLLYTGLRAGDVALLRYENIDVKRKRITQLIRKSRRVHELPLSVHLVNLLGEIKGRTGPVFPDLYTGDERRLNDNLAKPRKHMQALLKTEKRPKATLHSFRVTYNNMLRDQGMTIQDRQILLAHTSSETTKIYTHPNAELAEKYLDGLVNYLIEGKD